MSDEKSQRIIDAFIDEMHADPEWLRIAEQAMYDIVMFGEVMPATRELSAAFISRYSAKLKRDQSSP